LVKNGSFGDRFVEGIYLQKFVPTTTRRVFTCIVSPQDLNSLARISNRTPMKCLFKIPCAYYGALQSFSKDLAQMHIGDAHDDNLVPEETTLHPYTRARTRAADAAKALDDPIILTTSPDDQTKSLSTKSAHRRRVLWYHSHSQKSLLYKT